MSQEKRRQKAKFRILKKNKIWVTTIFCLAVTLLAMVFISVFASSLFTYYANKVILDEYDAISYMARIYDINSVEEGDNIFNMLNEEGRTYYITDNHGDIIYINGDNTMGTSKGIVELPTIQFDGTTVNEKVLVYVDNATEGLLETDEDGNVSISAKSVLSWLYTVDQRANINFDTERSTADLPIWISVNVKGGTQKFFGKAIFRVSMTDIMFLGAFLLAGMLLVVCVIFLMIVNMITTMLGQRRITNAFFTDPVTKDKNWMWFCYKGEQILKKRKNASRQFVILDLVFVRYRNYCVCHSVSEGEDFLCQVNKIVKKNLKKQELCTHYASANFAVLLEFSDKESLEKRISEIISQLEKIDSEHKFTFHVGVFFVERRINPKNKKFAGRKDINIEREYNNACTARSTLEGNDDSGIAYFDTELVEEQKWIDMVQENQRQAVENEEFVIHYQPKYDPKNNELRGVEALIRWDSPNFGFKAPTTFIPIFEKNGFIPEIDHYMIRHVARAQKAWLDAGYKCVPASVNVSRAHFIEKDLAEQIRDDVDAEGAPHELIEIELTESAFFDDKKTMIETICKLKEYGFQVSMDDFGSGYSSLNSLKDMPLDVLKLDAGFFSGDFDDNRGEIVVSDTIKLAKNLNMVTVAEGVEFKEQVDFLAEQGCDMIQGYFYARPMPADEYILKMERSKAENEIINPES